MDHPSPASVLVVLDDPRLAGWRQSGDLHVQSGDVVSVVDIQNVSQGDIFDRQERLQVWVNVQNESGATLPIALHFTREPATRYDLKSVRGIEKWLIEMMEVKDLKEAVNGFVYGSSPPIEFEYSGLNEVPGYIHGLIHMIGVVRERYPGFEETLEALLNNAIMVGRRVRESELKHEYERAAQSGLLSTKAGNIGGKLSGEQRRVDADAWKSLALPVAQSFDQGIGRDWDRGKMAQEIIFKLDLKKPGSRQVEEWLRLEAEKPNGPIRSRARTRRK